MIVNSGTSPSRRIPSPSVEAILCKDSRMRVQIKREKCIDFGLPCRRRRSCRKWSMLPNIDKCTISLFKTTNTYPAMRCSQALRNKREGCDPHTPLRWSVDCIYVESGREVDYVGLVGTYEVFELRMPSIVSLDRLFHHLSHVLPGNLRRVESAPLSLYQGSALVKPAQEVRRRTWYKRCRGTLTWSRRWSSYPLAGQQDPFAFRDTSNRCVPKCRASAIRQRSHASGSLMQSEDTFAQPQHISARPLSIGRSAHGRRWKSPLRLKMR